MSSSEPIVAAHALRKVYSGASDVEALKGIDVEIGRGTLTAIVGPSGSGKTTLLNCLSGLEQIDGGKVVVEGADLASMQDDARTDLRARRMGFVFQAFNLLPVLTAAENVELPLLLVGTPARAARERAIATLGLVGLAERAGHRPEQLSGGEQQRVAVARALVHEPAVVWADEPTGNLDSESTEAIMTLLESLHRGGQTIVMVTHNAALAERAERIVHMRDGRIEDVEIPTATLAPKKGPAARRPARRPQPAAKKPAAKKPAAKKPAVKKPAAKKRAR